MKIIKFISLWNPFFSKVLVEPFYFNKPKNVNFNLCLVKFYKKIWLGYGYNRNDKPMFLSTVPNITVSAGREAVLSCSVSNLNDYKVRFVCNMECLLYNRNFNTNIPVSWLHNNLCEFIALEIKFKRWFCTQKLVLNVRFKVFWVKNIYCLPESFNTNI